MNVEPPSELDAAVGSAQARLLGKLQARVMRLPRDEFGEHNALATEAAYRRVQDLINGMLEDPGQRG